MNALCCGSSILADNRVISPTSPTSADPWKSTLSALSPLRLDKGLSKTNSFATGGGAEMPPQPIKQASKDNHSSRDCSPQDTSRPGAATSSNEFQLSDAGVAGNGNRHVSFGKGSELGGGGGRRHQKGSSGSLLLPPPPPTAAAVGCVDHLASIRSSMYDGTAEFKINHLAGNWISGVLLKWVNYGKGWRPRLFVLRDGVLSYYKIHGPDKINVNQETEKGSRIIGEESYRRISRRHSHINQHARGNGGDQFFRGKPIGEVHLKVSTIRESRSDDKRFSIFTGTKRLHLRAETNDDRRKWLEALLAVKDMYPRMPNSELMTPVDNFMISMDKLRQRLVDEGLQDGAIQDIEKIVEDEVSGLQKQLFALKQKQSLLLDTLRQLETEKVDLEDTVVDESQRHDDGCSSRSRDEKYRGMASLKGFLVELVI